MSSTAAARPKCPSSATVTKNRRWRIRSMAGDSISTGGRFADPGVSRGRIPSVVPVSNSGDSFSDSCGRRVGIGGTIPVGGVLSA